jgi:MIP family channel proteins
MPSLYESPLYRATAAEFVGSGLFLFTVITTAVNYPAAQALGGANLLAPIGVATVFGVTISTLAYTFGDVSGAHLNPAVTLGFLVRKSIEPTRAALYITARFMGATCGACLARLVSDWDLYDAGGRGVNYVTHGHALWQALIAEIVATAFLVTVVLHVSYLATKQYGHGPLAIGGAVLVCHLALIPITGTSINPARSIGAAVASGSNAHHQWSQIWIFLAGPLVGGAMAGLNPLWGDRARTEAGLPQPTPAPGLAA